MAGTARDVDVWARHRDRQRRLSRDARLERHAPWVALAAGVCVSAVLIGVAQLLGSPPPELFLTLVS